MPTLQRRVVRLYNERLVAKTSKPGLLPPRLQHVGSRMMRGNNTSGQSCKRFLGPEINPTSITGSLPPKGHRLFVSWEGGRCLIQAIRNQGPTSPEDSPHSFPLPQPASHTHQRALSNEVPRGHRPC